MFVSFCRERSTLLTHPREERTCLEQGLEAEQSNFSIRDYRARLQRACNDKKEGSLRTLFSVIARNPELVEGDKAIPLNYHNLPAIGFEQRIATWEF